MLQGRFSPRSAYSPVLSWLGHRGLVALGLPVVFLATLFRMVGQRPDLRPQLTATVLVAGLLASLLLAVVAGWAVRRFIAAVARGADDTQCLIVLALVAAITLLAVFGIDWGEPGFRSWAADEVRPVDVIEGFKVRFSGGWFDVYPPLHYYVLALFYAPFLAVWQFGWCDLAQPVPYGALSLLGRLVSAVAAGVTAATLYLVARTVGHSWRVATMAVVVAASMPIYVYYGRVANLDMPYVMWSALALLAYAQILTGGDDARRHALLGLAAALAVGTKDQAYAFFPVIALHLLWRAWARRSGRSLPRLASTLGDRALWAGLGVFVAVLLVVDNVTFNAAGLRHHVALIVGPMSAHYRMYDRTWIGEARMIRDAAIQVPWCLGWLPTLAALGGVWLTVRRRDWTTAAIVGVPLVSWYVCFIAVIAYDYDRFFLGICLGLALLAGIGLDWLVEHLRPRVAGVAAVATVLAVGVLTGASVPILMHADTRYVVERWLAEHRRPDTVVAFTGLREYLPRLLPPGPVEIGATPQSLAAVRPHLLVTNWHFSVRSRSQATNWRFYEALEQEELGYRRVLRLRRTPWTLLGWIDGVSFGGRLTAEELTPATNLNKISPEIRVYARNAP
jgi:4-amino-4-deoxy-L-arabinose transferase-like glycosyltransferase